MEIHLNTFRLINTKEGGGDLYGSKTDDHHLVFTSDVWCCILQLLSNCLSIEILIDNVDDNMYSNIHIEV